MNEALSPTPRHQRLAERLTNAERGWVVRLLELRPFPPKKVSATTLTLLTDGQLDALAAMVGQRERTDAGRVA